MNNKLNPAEWLILTLIALSLLSSCNKERNDVFSEYTALKFTEKKEVNLPNYKYEYTLLKYNNSWYSRILPDNTKKTFTDVLQIPVYSNQDKPMYKWIGYVEWMKDTTILTFRNPAIDSIPTYYKKIEATDTELRNM